MLKIQEIREIIKLIDQSSIQKFTFESDGGKIKLEKNGGQAVTTVTEAPQAAPAPVQAPVAAPVAVVAPAPTATPEAPAAPATEVASDEKLHEITSPMVGTYYKAASPDAEAYVKKGDKVTAESIVCIVEAMKLFNEIESEVNGEIVEILVQDGQLVEYGQPLFLVREN